MKYGKIVSNPTIKRLPIYYRYLSTLLDYGINRISSKDLARKMGITDSQVRQDFFQLGGTGQKGYGYDVKLLHDEMHRILGLDRPRNAIIIGAGSLGQALAKHADFYKNGFRFIGIFDINPKVIGEKIRDIEITHFDTLQEFFENNQVDIAAITVPVSSAHEVTRMVIDNGIKAIWNFTPVELKAPDDIVIENIHLSDSLMVLGYKLSEIEKK